MMKSPQKWNIIIAKLKIVKLHQRYQKILMVTRFLFRTQIMLFLIKIKMEGLLRILINLYKMKMEN